VEVTQADSNGKMLVMWGDARRERARGSLLARLPPTRPRAALRQVALVASVGLATAVIGVVLPWVGPLRPGVGWGSIVVQILAGLTMLGAGLIAWTRQPANTIWRLMVASYFAGFIWELSFIPSSVFWTLSLLLANLGQAIFAHLLLAFPSGRLRSPAERLLVSFIYAYAVGTPLLEMLFSKPSYVCSGYCPQNLLVVWPNNDVADAIGRFGGLGVPLVGALLAFLVWLHWRRASAPARSVLQPVVVALPFFFVSTSLGYPADSLGIDIISSLVRSPVWRLTDFILPVAFLLGVLRLRATRAAVASAVLEIGALPTLTRLQEVLRARLGDPKLEVLRWSEAQGAFIDQDGRATSSPTGAGNQTLTVLERDGEPAAAVRHDAAISEEPALTDTIRAAARMALDATELQDELRARGGQAGGLPTGEVTFLFGDIQGSTPLLESLGAQYAGVLAELRRIASEVADRHTGRLVDARADEVFLVFQHAPDAVGSAVELTARLSAMTWPGNASVRVRIGLHTGSPALTRSGYVGLDVHRAARIMALAHGGQILASEATVASFDRKGKITIRALGRYALRGVSEPLSIVEMAEADREHHFPPPRGDRVG
jgi:class 3 adenylate cyclase